MDDDSDYDTPPSAPIHKKPRVEKDKGMALVSNQHVLAQLAPYMYRDETDPENSTPPTSDIATYDLSVMSAVITRLAGKGQVEPCRPTLQLSATAFRGVEPSPSIIWMRDITGGKYYPFVILNSKRGDLVVPRLAFYLRMSGSSKVSRPHGNYVIARDDTVPGQPRNLGEGISAASVRYIDHPSKPVEDLLRESGVPFPLQDLPTNFNSGVVSHILGEPVFVTANPSNAHHFYEVLGRSGKVVNPATGKKMDALPIFPLLQRTENGSAALRVPNMALVPERASAYLEKSDIVSGDIVEQFSREFGTRQLFMPVYDTKHEWHIKQFVVPTAYPRGRFGTFDSLLYHEASTIMSDIPGFSDGVAELVVRGLNWTGTVQSWANRVKMAGALHYAPYSLPATKDMRAAWDNFYPCAVRTAVDGCLNLTIVEAYYGKIVWDDGSESRIMTIGDSSASVGLPFSNIDVHDRQGAGLSNDKAAFLPSILLTTHAFCSYLAASFGTNAEQAISEYPNQVLPFLLGRVFPKEEYIKWDKFKIRGQRAIYIPGAIPQFMANAYFSALLDQWPNLLSTEVTSHYVGGLDYGHGNFLPIMTRIWDRAVTSEKHFSVHFMSDNIFIAIYLGGHLWWTSMDMTQMESSVRKELAKPFITHLLHTMKTKMNLPVPETIESVLPQLLTDAFVDQLCVLGTSVFRTPQQGSGNKLTGQLNSGVTALLCSMLYDGYTAVELREALESQAVFEKSKLYTDIRALGLWPRLELSYQLPVEVLNEEEVVSYRFLAERFALDFLGQDALVVRAREVNLLDLDLPERDTIAPVLNDQRLVKMLFSDSKSETNTPVDVNYLRIAKLESCKVLAGSCFSAATYPYVKLQALQEVRLDALHKSVIGDNDFAPLERIINALLDTQYSEEISQMVASGKTLTSRQVAAILLKPRERELRTFPTLSATLQLYSEYDHDPAIDVVSKLWRGKKLSVENFLVAGKAPKGPPPAKLPSGLTQNPRPKKQQPLPIAPATFPRELPEEQWTFAHKQAFNRFEKNFKVDPSRALATIGSGTASPAVYDVLWRIKYATDEIKAKAIAAAVAGLSKVLDDPLSSQPIPVASTPGKKFKQEKYGQVKEIIAKSKTAKPLKRIGAPKAPVPIPKYVNTKIKVLGGKREVTFEEEPTREKSVSPGYKPEPMYDPRSPPPPSPPPTPTAPPRLKRALSPAEPEDLFPDSSSEDFGDTGNLPVFNLPSDEENDFSEPEPGLISKARELISHYEEHGEPSEEEEQLGAESDFGSDFD